LAQERPVHHAGPIVVVVVVVVVVAMVFAWLRGALAPALGRWLCEPSKAEP
jgi:hypothetical protein